MALGLLVAGGWAASGWWDIRWWKGDAYFYSLDGSIGMRFEKGSLAKLLDGELLSVERKDSYSLSWQATYSGWPVPTGRDLAVLAYGGASSNLWYIALAVWPIPLLLWTAAALLLRSGILARRRANTNACAKCGYSLAGLAAGAACPECGKGAKVVA